MVQVMWDVKNIYLNIKGSFGNNVYLYANGSKRIGSNLHITLAQKQIFNLICGKSPKSCSGTINYTCYGGISYCNGIKRGTNGGCANIKPQNWQIQS